MSDFGFKTTRWSVVQKAKWTGKEGAKGAVSEDGASEETARDALSRLCEIYYEPIRRYIRAVLARESADGRGGGVRYGGRTADDLTHDFFAALLEKGLGGGLDRRNGKFRAWLLACVKHFLAKRRESESAQKRGGGEFPRSARHGDFVRSFGRRAPFSAGRLFRPRLGGGRHRRRVGRRADRDVPSGVDRPLRDGPPSERGQGSDNRGNRNERNRLSGRAGPTSQNLPRSVKGASRRHARP